MVTSEQGHHQRRVNWGFILFIFIWILIDPLRPAPPTPLRSDGGHWAAHGCMPGESQVDN